MIDYEYMYLSIDAMPNIKYYINNTIQYNTIQNTILYYTVLYILDNIGNYM